MKRIKYLYGLLISLLLLCTGFFELKAEKHVSESTAKAMTEEAENWIDDMPEGLQDRLSDAVAHSLRNSTQELVYYRNITPLDSLQRVGVSVNEYYSSEGLKYRVYSAEETLLKETPALIYFHGGGWTMGSLNDAEKLCCDLAREGGIKVISIDYPLAPDNSPLNVIIKSVGAIKEILDNKENLNITDGKISLGGDGAGGNVALTSYFYLIEESPETKIKSIVLYYPLLTVEQIETTSSWKKFGKGYGLDRRLMEDFLLAYVGNNPALVSQKLIVSPLLADNELLSLLPPIMIIAAERDIVTDEIIEFKNRLKENGLSIDYIEFPGAIHGFMTDRVQPTAFKEAVALTIDFLKE